MVPLRVGGSYFHSAVYKFFKSKEDDGMKSLEGIKDSRIRLRVTNLCDDNLESIKKLINLKNVEGLILKNRYFNEKLIHM